MITYGIERGDFHAKDLKVSGNGLGFKMVTPQGEIPIWSPLLGRVNVYNLVAAAAAAYARDVEPNAISEAADQIAHVAGRFQRLDLGQPFTVIVDYAHTDDAIRNLTAVAHDFLHQRGGPGRVITVFGCGGDRDRTKRPLMGEAAGQRQRLRGPDQRQSAQRRPHRHHERRVARAAAHRRPLHAGA